MDTEESTELTIFTAGDKERKKAIEALIRGRTPTNEIRKRPGRGGKEQSYVNTYYMTRQIALLTGFRWKTEKLDEKARPNWDNPVEVGTFVRVTIWDERGNQYSHESWGQKDVAKWDSDGKNHKAGELISLFDDLKASYSDAIKKCLSYFGIANDIYGGREMTLDDLTAETSSSSAQPLASDEAKRIFSNSITKYNIRWSEVFTLLGIKSTNEITDYKKAWDAIKEKKGIKEVV